MPGPLQPRRGSSGKELPLPGLGKGQTVSYWLSERLLGGLQVPKDHGRRQLMRRTWRGAAIHKNTAATTMQPIT